MQKRVTGKESVSDRAVEGKEKRKILNQIPILILIQYNSRFFPPETVEKYRI